MIEVGLVRAGIPGPESISIEAPEPGTYELRPEIGETCRVCADVPITIDGTRIPARTPVTVRFPSTPAAVVSRGPAS
ncbi:MAG TPA: hypothetical protein VLV17_05680 [Anaeromyxobacteraceae bacterium]|nr:hypothetical protein [Anaeromyxobacteraceae bacterium]